MRMVFSVKFAEFYPYAEQRLASDFAAVEDGDDLAGRRRRASSNSSSMNRFIAAGAAHWSSSQSAAPPVTAPISPTAA